MVHHGVKLGIVAAQPDDACSPLLNSTDMLGKAVLVKRGGCAFHSKANEIERAGGRVMVMGNYHLDPYIFRMVCQNNKSLSSSSSLYIPHGVPEQ